MYYVTNLRIEKRVIIHNQPLSEDVMQLLNGESLDKKQHDAMMLLTVCEDGWPHTAMISVGEIVAIDSSLVRIGLWPNTTTTNNILRSGKATLVIVYNGKAHYIRLQLERLPERPQAKQKLERFSASVIAVRADVAKYATITSGIQFDLKDPTNVLIRWQESIKELKTNL